MFSSEQPTVIEEEGKAAEGVVEVGKAVAVTNDLPNVALSSAGGGAFDAGLLIAFPVIVGTLFLFFVFPFVGPQLAQNFPAN